MSQSLPLFQLYDSILHIFEDQDHMLWQMSHRVSQGRGRSLMKLVYSLMRENPILPFEFPEMQQYYLCSQN